MSHPRAVELLRTIGPFSALPDEVRRAVVDRCQPVTVRAGTRLIAAGEVPAALLLVVSGQIRVLDERHPDQPLSIDVLGSGALAGETMFEGTPAAFSVWTLADSELLQLSGADLVQLLSAEPLLEAAIREHVAVRAPRDLPASGGARRESAAPASPPADAAEPGVDAAPGGATRSGRRSFAQAFVPLLPYVRPLYPLIAELVAASLTVQLLALLLPIFARFVVDDVIARADAQWLQPAALAMSGVLLLYLLASAARRYLTDFISRQIDARLLADLYRHLLRLPIRFFDARQTGDIVGTFDDLGRVTGFLTRTGVGFFTDLLTAVLYVALMAHYSGALTAVAVAFVAAEVATLYFVTPHLQLGFRAFAGQEVDSDSLLIESLAGLKTIKMLAMEPAVRWRMHQRLARMTNTSLATLTYRSAARLATDAATGAGTLAVLVAGAALVLSGRMTIGELVAFGILTQGLTRPFAQLVAAWDEVQDTAESVHKVTDVLRREPETTPRPSPEQIVLQRLQGHVRFEAVAFRYADDAPDVLRDISFECYGGQRVAILGRSGSGKSTLIKLLLGLHAPTAGAISIDGFPIGEIWLPALRRQMGVVLQDATLFRGTIRANISHTLPAAPLGEVVAAASHVNAHRFITALPAGYDTELDENGANLSGGQRQQIAIARALLHLPRVIILDEATSNVDNESARLLQQNLDLAFKDATLITITQRLDAARGADLILVLDRGTIVEQGTDDELLARGGLYGQLLSAQAV